MKRPILSGLGAATEADTRCARNGISALQTGSTNPLGQFVAARAASSLRHALGPIAILLWIAVSATNAQVPLPDSFDPGADGAVYTLAMQADGKILVGGKFTRIGGQSRNHIARLNAGGILDSDFAPGASSNVCALALQADRKILVAGEFTMIGVQPRRYLARLNADGTLDTKFNPRPSYIVYALAVQPDGKILIGGEFTMVGEQWRDQIARLNSDGTLDSSFNPGTEGLGRKVHSLALQADGKILVSGLFTALAGQPRNNIGRLNADGSLDSGFNPEMGGPAYSMAVQPDGKILVGRFSMIDGQASSFLARLNPNGTVDSSFNPGANSHVTSVAVQADGKILAGGYFTTLGGQQRGHIGRLHADGTVDDNFNPGASAPVYSLGVQADGKILVGGNFTAVGGQARSYVGRLNNTEPASQRLSYDGSTITWLRGGSSPELWGASFDVSTNATDWTHLGQGSWMPGGWRLNGVSLPSEATLRARGCISGGYYNASGGFVHAYYGKLVFFAQPTCRTNDAGTTATFSVLACGTEPLSFQWLKDGVPLADEGNVSQTATAVLILTNVLSGDAGGYRVVVSNGSGSVTSAVARLMVRDPAIAIQPASQNREPGQSLTFSVTAAGTAPFAYQWWKEEVILPGETGASLSLLNLQVSDAGNYRVVVTNQYGSVTSAVALLTVNLATLDTGFNPALDGNVYSMAIQADGKILLGGYLNTPGAQRWHTIGRLNADGSLDVSFNLVANNPVNSIVVQADRKIVIGGSFTALGGQRRNYLARLHPDGTLDNSFNPGADFPVRSLALQADGKILIGGSFSRLGGQPRNRIGRLHPDGTLDSNFNPGADSLVNCLVLQPDGQIIVGGYFTVLAGEPRNYIARLNPDGTLDTGFDPGADYYVTLLELQADGKIVVGGNFTILGGEPRNYLGRLNADGTLDAGFNPGADDYVSTVAVQTDGSILLGGRFTSIGGHPRNYLARLNADGSLDSGFSPEANSSVSSLAVQADGKILVRGQFTTLAGQQCDHLGRLNNTEPATQSLSYDGSTITWLRGGTSPEVWRTTFDVSTNGSDWAPLGEGSRIVGGWQLTGVSLPPGLALWARGYVSGSYHNAFYGRAGFVAQPASRTNDPGTTATFSVMAGSAESLTFQWLRDEVPLVDGGNIAGTATPVLLLTNVLGGDAGGYRVVVSNIFGAVTSAVAKLTVMDPKITVQPASQNRNAGQSVTFSVTAVGTAPFGYQWWREDMPVGGGAAAFLTLNNLQAADAGNYRVVVSNPYGSVTSAVVLLTVNVATLDRAFNAGPNGAVFALAVQGDGKILVGGSFLMLGGQSRYGIGRLDADGILDSGFNPATLGVGDYPGVLSVVVQADGRIVLGGDITKVGGELRDRIARVRTDGMLDDQFNPGANRTVMSLALQTDGKILVGGAFNILGGQPRNHLARLNGDGTLDSGFDPGASSDVYSLAVQGDGKILVGGAFTNLGGQSRARIGRLNADGTLDAGFNPGTSSNVYSLAVQADGKILAGGAFATLGGQPRSNFGRLNADGTLDIGFNPGASDYVLSVALQTDGKILVGGAFTNLGGQARNRIARLNADGTLDSRFDPGANGDVYSLGVQPDGEILVGGTFHTLGREPRYGLGRLNNTEPATQSLNYNGSTITWLRGGTSPEVWHCTFEVSTNARGWTFLGEGSRIPGGWGLVGVSLPPEGTLRARGYVAEGYRNASGGIVEAYYGRPFFFLHPASRTNDAGTTATFSVVAAGSEPLAFRWYKDGMPLLDGGTIAGTGSAVLRLAHVLGGDAGSYSVVVSNGFGIVTSAVARLTVMDPVITVQPASQNKEAGQNVTLSVTAVGTVPLDYQWWKEELVFAWGNGNSLTLTNLQGMDAGNYRLVVSNRYGSVTSAVAMVTVNLATLDSGFDPVPNAGVGSIAMQADGKILLGGWFTRLGGQLRNYLARLNADGTLDSGFNAGPNGYVSSLAVQADGKILAGGDFSMICGQPRNRIARLNGDGTLDGAFNPVAISDVYSLILQADRKILVGGSFTNLSGQSRNYLARLETDGTLDGGFNPGASSTVHSLSVQPDGKVLLGGSFSSVGGQPRHSLARLNPDGTLDSGFNPGANGYVASLAVQADGAILVGGNFTALGGQARNYLARLNADGSLDTEFDPEPNGYVSSLAVQADGKILVGGNFTVVGGQLRDYLARLNADGALDSNFNPGADGNVSLLALQADGKILVNSSFMSPGGAFRTYFRRLNNTEPAAQSLTYDGSTIIWPRGGTSPEVWRTSFDVSVNGSGWTALGEGSRIPGGWGLIGVSLPPDGTLRARGYIAGTDNASGWFVETVAQGPWPLRLNLVQAGSDVVLSWTGGRGPYQVQQTTNLGGSNSWENVGEPSETNSFKLPLGTGNLFLRVRGQ